MGSPQKKQAASVDIKMDFKGEREKKGYYRSDQSDGLPQPSRLTTGSDGFQGDSMTNTNTLEQGFNKLLRCGRVVRVYCQL